MSYGFTFTAENKTLKEVFFSLWKFKVPRFQRPYAWDIDQATDFWDDLITHDEPYFFGSLILNKEYEKRDGYVDIIDGQQRLITVTIFCAVMRDLAKTLDESRAQKYQRYDILIEDPYSDLTTCRLTPSESLFNFFKSNIQDYENNIFESSPSSREEKRVKKVYQYIYEKMENELAGYSSKARKIKALDNYRVRLSDLIVVSIEISREEDAYEIFETTNARGLELSVADLLKNLIFKQLKPEKKSDKAKDAWQELTSYIEATPTELKKFIRYYWLSKYSFVPEKRLYKEIKKNISDYQSLLDDLKNSSFWYNKLFVGTEEDFKGIKSGKKIFETLFALKLMRVTQCYVLILCLLRNHKSIPRDLSKTFKLLERFSFQYFVVCRYPANRVERLFSSHAIEFEKLAKSKSKHKLKNINRQIAKLEAELLELSPDKEVFLDEFMSLDYRDSERRRQLVTYILNEYNNHLRKSAEQKIDFNEVNIEHVLPRNPSKDWKLSKNDIGPYVNLLGNLTLLSTQLNSAAQNSTLDVKIDDYNKSTLPITKSLVRKLRRSKLIWNEEKIRARQKDLAELAYKELWILQ
jgi:uncharacterized protein with ParB-like and HNH nuclease domain